MSFFFDGYFCLLISELIKNRMFVFLVSGTTSGTSLVGLDRATYVPRQRQPPLVVLVQVQPSPERWNLRRRRNPGRSRNGTRPRAAGGTPGWVKLLYPRRFFFPQKRAGYFFLKLCVFFWFGCMDQQKGRERA